MNFAVVHFFSTPLLQMEITEDEFEHARDSREMLTLAMGVEEKFNVLLENYVEYERDLLGENLQKALSSLLNWSEGANARHLMNRRLANLLSTARLYLDQLHHDLSRMVGNSAPGAKAVKAETSAQYDTRPGYLVMEALRNHVQHRGLPVHKIRFGGKWIEIEGVRKRRQRTVVLLDVARIEEEGDFKKKALDKLKSMGEEVSISPLVREYVTGLMAVHKRFREEMKTHVEKWDQCFCDLEDGFREKTGKGASGELHFVAYKGDSLKEEHSLLIELIERRKQLEKKNSGFGDLTDLIITS